MRQVPQLREAERPDDSGGDLGPQWSHTFFTMFSKRLVAEWPQRPGQSAAANHRQLRQPAAGESGGRRNSRSGARSGCGKAAHPTPEATRDYAMPRGTLRSRHGSLGHGANLLKERCSKCHDSDPDAKNGIDKNQAEVREAFNASDGRLRASGFENDPSPNILLISPAGIVAATPRRKPRADSGAAGWFCQHPDPGYQQLSAAHERGKPSGFGTPVRNPGLPAQSAICSRTTKKYGVIPPGFDLARKNPWIISRPTRPIGDPFGPCLTAL